eukprot:763941-Hanusia_phi.AAC.3
MSCASQQSDFRVTTSSLYSTPPYPLLSSIPSSPPLLYSLPSPVPLYSLALLCPYLLSRPALICGLFLASSPHGPSSSLPHSSSPLTCRATNMAWPMCRPPVTLGGGIGSTYDFFSPSSYSLGLNSPLASHHLYSGSSTSCGLYWGGISSPSVMQEGMGRDSCLLSVAVALQWEARELRPPRSRPMLNLSATLDAPNTPPRARAEIPLLTRGESELAAGNDPEENPPLILRGRDGAEIASSMPETVRKDLVSTCRRPMAMS